MPNARSRAWDYFFSFQLSVALQSIAWKDLSPRWPIMCRQGCKTLLTPLSLTDAIRSIYHSLMFIVNSLIAVDVSVCVSM